MRRCAVTAVRMGLRALRAERGGVVYAGRARLIVGVVAALLLVPAAYAVPVVFPDPNLDAVVRDVIGKPVGFIDHTELQGVGFTHLFASSKLIGDLTGLDACTDLVEIDLRDNAITDVTPLGGMPNLVQLRLDRNQIVNVSPLAGLLTLVELGLSENLIGDVFPLAGLANLEALDLSGNLITDVTPLGFLPLLERLALSANTFGDVDPLGLLPEIRYLWLDANVITTVAGLLPSPGLGAGDFVNLRGNALVANAYCTDIPALRARGVTVVADGECGGTPVVTFPDPGLDAAVRDAIGVPAGVLIQLDDLVGTGFNALDASGRGITDLRGLEYCTDLIDLDLSLNSLVDISPLAALDMLELLHLWGNEIDDITALYRLRNLVELEAFANQITDVTPLAYAGAMDNLGLEDNLIVEVDALAALFALTDLGLSGNNITEIGALTGLPNLTTLGLSRNSVTNLTLLPRLTALVTLELAANGIDNVEPLAGMTNLEVLALGQNLIVDLDPLVGLPNLVAVSLSDNAITDIAPLVGNAGLDAGDNIDLSANPLSNRALCDDIPLLTGRGVVVIFDGVCVGSGAIEGELTDATTGAALTCAAVYVELSTGDTYARAVNREGGYRMAGLPPGLHTVNAVAPGYADASTFSVVLPNSTVSADLALTPLTTEPDVRGTVRDADTVRELGGVRVNAYVGGVLMATTYTCASGVFEFHDLATKTTTVTLEYTSDNYETAVEDVEVTPGETTTTDPELTPKVALFGSLVGVVEDDSTSEGIQNAQVMATSTSSGGVTYTAYTLTDGSYIIPAMDPGSYDVQVSHDSYDTEDDQVVVYESALPTEKDFSLTAGSSPSPNGCGTISVEALRGGRNGDAVILSCAALALLLAAVSRRGASTRRFSAAS